MHYYYSVHDYLDFMSHMIYMVARLKTFNLLSHRKKIITVFPLISAGLQINAIL